MNELIPDATSLVDTVDLEIVVDTVHTIGEEGVRTHAFFRGC